MSQGRLELEFKHKANVQTIFSPVSFRTKQKSRWIWLKTRHVVRESRAISISLSTPMKNFNSKLDANTMSEDPVPTSDPDRTAALEDFPKISDFWAKIWKIREKNELNAKSTADVDFKRIANFCNDVRFGSSFNFRDDHERFCFHFDY